LNNISQDKEKLLKLLEELEEEFQAGNISDSKYKYLSNEYEDRLSDMTAVDRIRAMQGKKMVEKPAISPSKKQLAEKSKKEDEKLTDKYVVKTEKERKESKTFNRRIFATIAIACLILAFTAGIGFGIFNFDFQPTNPVNAVVTVNETAFPVVTSNDTNKTDQKNTTTINSGNSNVKSNSSSNTNTNKNSNKNSNKNDKKDSDKVDSSKSNSNNNKRTR
jgi:hypothetical protein